MPYAPIPLTGKVESIEQLLDYVSREFNRLADESLRGTDKIILPELHVAPAKPRLGMIVLADGTDWNPGAGAGFYGYRGGAWVKLG